MIALPKFSELPFYGVGFLLLILSAAEGSIIGGDLSICNDEQWEEHPVLCHHLDRKANEPEQLARELKAWAEEAGLIVQWDWLPKSNVDLARSTKRQLAADGSSGTPVVFAHGMGDSCFNEGMQRITQHAADLIGKGTYGTCIPIGQTWHEDTTNGYLKNMDVSVEIFAEQVKNDPKLADGFFGIGLSQGNNVLRGYIAKHNDPPVKRFISINGVNAGVGAVPHCIPKATTTFRGKDDPRLQLSDMCDILMEQASKRAYSHFAQEHSFQANYWRDPRPVEKLNYRTYSQLAQWNNEGLQVNQTLNDNWARTDKFVWIMAEKDGMVWPKEGEHWGAPDPTDPFNKILPMNETEWYIKDLFGLKTAQEAGKNAFESFDGDHLQFNDEDFTRWVTTYLI